ncbi:MAG: peptidase and in kexin sedolisin [Actinomycetia bacterium]|nr:peptidase and in kexin sedolisin [Actinomycetes bacterium]
MPLHLARSMVPLATALAVVSGCLLPVSAASAADGGADAAEAPAGPAHAAGSPDLAAEWWLTALGAPQAWSALTSAGSHARPGAGITVAVLSTGVDATHPDLAADVITGPDYSHSGVSPGNLFWGREGTAVASLIAAHGHGAGGAAGITGVAPGARILSLRVTLEYNDPRNANRSITAHLTSAIAAGIRYAASHGAAVIALPLDPGTLGTLAGGDPAAAGGSAAERAAVRAALADNVVLVAPAGDNAMSAGAVNYPAAYYPGVIAVGATDRSGRLESFSSRHSYAALSAPGGGMTVAAPGGYDTLTTTDMSAALVAGVAVLIRARYPKLPAAQVAEAIEKGTTSQPAGTAGSAGAGAGALNATQALHKAASLAATLPQPASSATEAAATATGKPSTAGIAPAALAASGGTAAGNSDLGNATASVLHYAAIGAGTLIAVLATLLLLVEIRRRRRSAARGQELARASRTGTGRTAASYPNTGRTAIGGPAPGRPAIGGSSTTTGGFPAINGGFPARGGGSPATTGGFPAITGGSPATAGGFPARRGGFPARGGHGTHAAGRGSQPATPSPAPGSSEQAMRGRESRRGLAAAPRAGAAGSRTADSWAAGPPAAGSPGPSASPDAPPVGTPRRRSRSSRIAQTGNVGSIGLPAPQPGRPDDSPPWPPARMPANATPALPAPVAPILPRPAQTEDSPPWEQDRDSLPQDPDGASFPARGNTGPMYIWNPATNSSPFPAAED